MLEAGRVVVALRGRDKDGFYLVVGIQKGRVLIADGERRRLLQPKAKNPVHLLPTEHIIPLSGVTGNRKLKKLLREFSQGEAAKQKVN